MPEQLELELPYVAITKVASRDYLRNNFTQTARASYWIPLSQIFEREGFNQRRIFSDIEELAMSIFVNKQKEPMVLDVLPDGTALIDEGARRFRAFQLLVEQKKIPADFLVEFYPNKRDVTEFDRMLRQHTSNNFKKKFKPIETAGVVYNLKHNFGKISNEELAEKMNCSRQSIDNYLLLAGASDIIKQQILVQDMNLKDSLDLIKNEKKLKAQGDKEELKHGQTGMYKTAAPFDPNADELASLKELEEKIIVAGEDDLPWTQVGEGGEDNEIRVTGNVEPQIGGNGKPLELVGNVAGDKNNDKKESTEKQLYDESRPELAWCQNIVRLLDKVENIADKLPDPQATKDINDRIGWMRKDMLELREWVKANKKQNKRDR